MIEITNKRLTMREAAQYLGHSYSWITSKHRSIGLRGYRIGGRWYFDLEDIQEWESQLKPQALSGKAGGSKNSKASSVQFV
jgi:excisionase family DNA binding protein